MPAPLYSNRKLEQIPPSKDGQMPQAGYTTGPYAHQPPSSERAVHTAPSDEAKEGCFNVQWVLFILALVIFSPACFIGMLLPLCTRFPTRCHKCASTLPIVAVDRNRYNGRILA